MQRALMIALLVAGMIPGTCAFAQPFGPPWRQQPGPQPPGPPQPGLQGVYGFTGTAACLVAPGSSNPVEPSGFDGALQPIYPTSSFSNSFAVEGIRIFHGDGTGVVNGTSVAITVRPTPGPPPLAQLSQLGEKSEQYQRRHSGSFHYIALVGRRAMFSGAVIRGGFCGGRSSLSWRARSFWSAVSSV